MTLPVFDMKRQRHCEVVHPLFETMELNATLFLQRMCIKVP